MQGFASLVFAGELLEKAIEAYEKERGWIAARWQIGALMRWVIVALILSVASPAAAMEYKEWAQLSLVYKRGYMFGIADSLMTFADFSNPRDVATLFGYRACLGGSTDELLVKQTEAFVTRNPTAFTEDMAVVAAKTLYEICKPKLDVELAKAGIK